MGRELKRVPLDFDWPIGMIWKGYHNPYSYQDCAACEKSGYNPATRAIEKSWYDYPGRATRLNYDYEGWCYNLEQIDVQALLDAGRLMDFTSYPLNEAQRVEYESLKDANGRVWPRYNNGYVPTAAEVNAWARKGRHDSINQMICVKAKAQRLGVYGFCKYCHGQGMIFLNDEFEQLWDNWQRVGPPTGPGYQLWSTTTDGHPMSPVFASLRELCDWAAENETVFGYQKATSDQWYKMLDDGFVFSTEGNVTFI